MKIITIFLADAPAIIRAERRALPEVQPDFFTFWASLLKYASAAGKCPGLTLSH